jgi:hypothetical protein
MTSFGSDKGRGNNYTPIYSRILKDRSNQSLTLFELGLGTNNLDVLSNMGVFGTPGASLRAWRHFFPNARIYGADIDQRILFNEDRIRTFQCDQLDQSSIRRLWSQPELQDGADILIEDGLHTFEGNLSFLNGSIDHLRPGGVYIAEDIEWDTIPQWYEHLETIYSKKYPSYEFAFVVLASHGPNNLLIIRRPLEAI